MNLCPCGARGVPGAACACTAQRLQRHRERLSRALLDRFDLALTVPRPRGVELAGPPGERSAAVAERVADARDRLRTTRPALSPAADELLTRAVERLPLSGRGRARVVTVAVTIAALATAARVDAEHLAEALSYRPPTELVE
jgi:magnesium chelatase family protein